MEAKELMIDDWVYYPTLKKSIQIKYGYQIEEVAVIGYEPIPLTNEILKKNGFEESIYSVITANGFERLPEYKYKNLKEARDIRRNLIRIVYSNTEGGVYDIQAGIGSHIFDLKYVHELQHALKIMKINLNIEL